MEALESQLREVFAKPAELDAGWVGDLIANAGRIRRRRVARRTAAVAVAVIAIVGAGAILHIVPSHAGPPMKPSHSVYPVPATVNMNGIEDLKSIRIDMLPDTLANLQMVDAEHGFSLEWSCPRTAPATPSASPAALVSPIRSGCSRDLRSTSDGGVTFQARSMPPAAVAMTVQGETLYALGNNHLVIERNVTMVNGRMPATNPVAWVSSDGGDTWQSAAQVPIRHVAAWPENVVLAQPETGAGALGIDASGALTVLDHAPGWADPLWPTTLDGALFVSVLNDTASYVYSSRDGGHTWQLADLPISSPDFGFRILGESAGRIYAYVTGDKSPTHEAFLVSSDQGRTWQDLDLPPLTPVAKSIYYGPPDRLSGAATPAGGLVINDGARTWRMAPGSTMFVADDQSFPVANIMAENGFMVAISGDIRQADPVPTKYMSVDGTHWTLPKN